MRPADDAIDVAGLRTRLLLRDRRPFPLHAAREAYASAVLSTRNSMSVFNRHSSSSAQSRARSRNNRALLSRREVAQPQRV
jgi:hypothetical protein